MESSWKRLSLSDPHSRIFLYKFNFTSDNYNLQITDLNQLWVEPLDRKDIIKRALVDDISIDASENVEQRRLLFQYISSALEGSPDTNIEIEEFSSDSVHLIATAKLPGNLPSLKWKLTPCISTQVSLANSFVVPALQHIMHLTNQTASLIEHLREKDRVISKLLSKLETSGIDLAVAFPNVQFKGSGTSSREAISKILKGLGEFDESKWRAAISSQEASNQSVETVLDAVLPLDGPSIHHSQADIEDESRRGSYKSPKIAQKTSQISLESTPPTAHQKFQVR